jgi:uncharacterized protein YdeI (YjbR/CyaY-like superfamily)
MADHPVVSFPDESAWEAWLESEHRTSNGVELRIARRGAAVTTVTSAQALEVALCFGWIDGRAKSLDDTYYLQRYTPRRPRSIWSQVNREKVEALIAAGRMRPAGLAEIERAKADGRWDAAYEPPSRATVPPDLQSALDADERAATVFAGLDARNRYAILHRLATAKLPETRARRLAAFVEMLREGRTLYP